MQRALAINEAVYGPEHPNVARTLGNLGIVQQELGELDEARLTQQRALAIKEAVYGSQHPEVASTLANLGGVQQELGELDDAREGVGRALAIFERVVGSDHPRTRRTQAHLLSLAANTPTGSATARTPSPSSKLLSRLRRGR